VFAMDILNLTVVLPAGDVNIPVEAKSTPGHLKENLKYSLRIPPKLIKLTLDGRELVDIKTMEEEPNNVKDGSRLVAQRREALTPEEEAEAAKAAEAAAADKQVVIHKDAAPPKPKPKSSVVAVRAVLKDGDVVKTSTLKQGRHSWKPQFIEGKHPERHLAFMRIETVLASKGTPVLVPLMPVRVVGLQAKPELNGSEGVVEKFDEEKGRWQTRLKDGKVLEVKPANLEVDNPQGKVYPENDPHGSVVLALGDPHTSPVWTAAAMQMEVGEKAEFTVAKKVLDFDPEGLAPTDSATTWRIELIRIVEAIDVLEDFSQLLHVVNTGGAARAEELDDVKAHWRVRRWMAEGNQCIASSRERIAITMQGLVSIEDQNAPPIAVCVGDGQQKALETVATRVGPGGSAHLYLKSDALKENRPAGTILFEVEVVELGLNRGPGTPGFEGFQSLLLERTKGDQWLDEADSARQKLETFSTLQKSTGQTKGAEEQTAQQVHKYADNAMKRYRRVLKWMEAEANMDDKHKLEKVKATMRMAKALALSHQRFGEAAEAEAGDAEKSALVRAQSLVRSTEYVLDACEGASQKDKLEYEGLMISLQVSLQAQDAEGARASLDMLTRKKPDEAEELKSFAALINRLETAISLKKGASAIEETQKELQTAVADKDKAKVIECLEVILDMLVNSKVTWEKVRTCKVGKDVGNAMKMGDPDCAKIAQTCVKEIQALATRAGLGL